MFDDWVIGSTVNMTNRTMNDVSYKYVENLSVTVNGSGYNLTSAFNLINVEVIYPTIGYMIIVVLAALILGVVLFGFKLTTELIKR